MFSVIIPVHNKLPHLERSVYSVLNQTFHDFELILVDDASSDGSSEKLRTFTDPRIRVLTRDVPGPGGYAARNLGISEARNRWICFLDADDEWKPDYLLKVSEAIRSNPANRLFASGYFVSDVTFSRNGMYYHRNPRFGSHEFDFSRFLLQKPVWTGAVVIEKDTLIRAGLFPEGKALRGGDEDLWLKVMSMIRTGYWINYVGAVYHRTSVNMVTRNIHMDFESMIVFKTVNRLIRTETDPKVVRALKKYWNNKAWFCFKTISRFRVITFSDLRYYFWEPGLLDYKVFKAIVYSLKHLFQPGRSPKSSPVPVNS